MRRSFPLFLLLFTALCVGLQLWTGVYGAGRSLTGDEASHFVNSLLVFDWLREAPLSSPLRYAEQYYLHFPRVTIGHWPPLFDIMQAVVFAVAGRSGAAALGFQALIAGLACAWPASLVQHRLGQAAGLATGLFVLASPNLLFLLDAVMVDTLLGVLALAAALCWARFAAARRLGWAVLFAAVSSTAILVKGNGFSLALLPFLYAAITRDPRPLLDWRAWLAATLVAAAVLPWYALTWAMAADGFNYHLGWDYTSHALPFYAVAIVQTLGAVGLVGFAACVWQLLRENRAVQDPTLAALVAAALALFLFQLVAPAATTPRYLVALVPSAAFPVAMGLAALVGLVPLRRRAVRAATALLVLAGAAAIFVPPHLSPYGMRALAGRVMHAEDTNQLVLVAGSPRAEGALIAAFAEQDLMRAHYVLRATQMLASGGFMAQGYATRFPNAAAFRQWLDQSGIGWLVLDISDEAATYAHNRQVADAAASAGWQLVERHPASGGEVRLYQRATDAPTPAQITALLSRVVPNKPLQLAKGSPWVKGPTHRCHERQGSVGHNMIFRGL